MVDDRHLVGKMVDQVDHLVDLLVVLQVLVDILDTAMDYSLGIDGVVEVPFVLVVEVDIDLDNQGLDCWEDIPDNAVAAEEDSYCQEVARTDHVEAEDILG